MKIKQSQLKTVLSIYKNTKTLSLENKNKKLSFYGKREGEFIKTSIIKNQEEDFEKFTIKSDFLFKTEQQNAEEFDLKIGKKSISSKVNDITFTTIKMNEDENVNFEEEKPEGIKLILTDKDFEKINTALQFTDKKTRENLMGINLKLKDNELKISATDSFKLYSYKRKEETDGEFKITIRNENIETLNIINELGGKKGVPIIITEKNIFIISKGLYYKSVLVAGAYPDIEKVIEKSKDEKVVSEITIDEDTIKKLKAIKNKNTKELNIKKENEEIEFETKTEISKNTFKISQKEGGDFKRIVDHDSIITASEIINKVEIKERIFFFKKEDTIIFIMKIKDDEE